jgi:hypothetical protein
MIVYLWQAGSAEGVAGDYGKAQEQAVTFMCRAGAGTAVIEEARFISGDTSLASGYQASADRRWVARRHLGCQVTWELRPVHERAAA